MGAAGAVPAAFRAGGVHTGEARAGTLTRAGDWRGQACVLGRGAGIAVKSAPPEGMGRP
jgi:hypothetical protein